MRALEVIYVYSAVANPPKPKFVVCVEPECNFFFYINSRGHHHISTPLIKEPDHQWLDHDSFVQVNAPLEFDDYIIDSDIEEHGIVGRVSDECAAAILSILSKDERVAKLDRDRIESAIKAALT